jgi:hypothetical protein
MIWNRGQNPQAAPGAVIVPKMPPKTPVVKLGKNAPAPGTPGYSLAYIEMVWKTEMDAAIARLHRRLESERKRLTRQYWLRFWPVAVGIAVACFAPALRETLDLLFKPWGEGLVFPFVVLLERPELHLHSSSLPNLMLYAEFPIEGFIAKCSISGKVTPLAVFGRVLCMHLLAGTLLLILSGAIM